MISNRRQSLSPAGLLSFFRSRGRRPRVSGAPPPFNAPLVQKSYSLFVNLRADVRLLSSHGLMTMCTVYKDEHVPKPFHVSISSSLQ